MGSRPKIWIALNGLEFTPPGADSPVCWPWTRILIAREVGLVPLDEEGSRLKGPDQASIVLRCSALHRDVARELRSRSLRTQLHDGARLSYVCKSGEWGAALFFGIFVVVCLVVAVFDKRDPAQWLAAAGACALIGGVFFWISSSRNVRELFISAGGLEAELRDGRRVKLPWRDLDRSGSQRTGALRSVNGLLLRFSCSAECRMGLVAAGAIRPPRMRNFIRLVARTAVLCVLVGAGAGVVGAFIWQLGALQRFAGVGPIWVFWKMVMAGIGMGFLLLFNFWGEYHFYQWLYPTGIKTQSVVPRCEWVSPDSSPTA